MVLAPIKTAVFANTYEPERKTEEKNIKRITHCNVKQKNVDLNQPYRASGALKGKSGKLNPEPDL